MVCRCWLLESLLQFDLLLDVASDPRTGRSHGVREDGAHTFLELPFGGKNRYFLARFVQQIGAMNLDFAQRVAIRRDVVGDRNVLHQEEYDCKCNDKSGCEAYSLRDRAPADSRFGHEYMVRL